MSFGGGAGGQNGDYAALGNGISELLATSLAANPLVRVVERERLQSVLAEQQLSASSAVDPETAVRVGKVLGAGHFVTGGYYIDPKGRMRLDVRSINVETSEIEYRQSTEGTQTKLFELIDRATRQLNAGLKFPSSRDNGIARLSGDGDRQITSTKLLGKALDAAAKGDTAAAVAAARDALAAFADLTAAKDLLARLQRKAPH